MKLSKENIYIPLEGKSEEERIEIVEFLESINEPCDEFLKIQIKHYEILEFFDGIWFSDQSAGNKTPITIEQLKEILQPMGMINLMGYSVLVDTEEQARKLQEIAFEQGITWRYGYKEIRHLDIKSFQFGFKGEKIITYSLNKKHYQDKYITKTAHFNDLFKEETLQEKEQRLLKELEEVRKEIEESKIKVGDWVVVKETKEIFKVDEVDIEYLDSQHEKITNPQLIELLENESK